MGDWKTVRATMKAFDFFKAYPWNVTSEKD